MARERDEYKGLKIKGIIRNPRPVDDGVIAIPVAINFRLNNRVILNKEYNPHLDTPMNYQIPYSDKIAWLIIDGTWAEAIIDENPVRADGWSLERIQQDKKSAHKLIGIVQELIITSPIKIFPD